MSGRPSQVTMDILFIEDNDDDVEAVRRVFAKSGVEARLQLARDGQEALEVLRRAYGRGLAESPTRPSLILLDLRLPKVDGMEVLRWLKAHPHLRCIPVVVLTGSGEEKPIRECMELGSNMYLLKPMNIADLMNIILGVQAYWVRADELGRLATVGGHAEDGLG